MEAECSLPWVAVGKGFAECIWAFAECPWLALGKAANSGSD